MIPPFEQIQSVSLANADRLLAGWFPRGRRVGKEFCVGNLAGDAGESLKINLTTGKGADFATGEGWPDLIGIRAAMLRIDRTAGARSVGDELGITSIGQDKQTAGFTTASKVTGGSWEPMIPPPSDAPKPNGVLNGFDMVHEYTALDDRPTHYVGRIEARDDRGKVFIPVTYGRLDGKLGWHKKAPTGRLPLYGLNRLTSMPDATVILCEGEKAADAAQAKFPDHACLSWMGGAKRAGDADLAPLKGRDVIVWPDNDAEGRKAAQHIARALSASLLRVNDLPAKADAADVSVEDPDAWLKARLVRPIPPPPPPECTLADLEAMQFAPMKWVVPGFIPEGLTVFAGRPKIGKSWLMLGVALAVARGTETLGQFVEKRDVLYCGLEDGKRRMQSRVAKILGPAVKGWPANFTFRHQLDAIDAGGMDYLEHWLTSSPNPGLIVIDVLGKVRGMKKPGEEQYQYDYRIVSALQELATRFGVAIVVIHHVRKSDAEDVLDTISGTTGIAGAADTGMVLGRTPTAVRLYVRGRDVEEVDKTVEFDPDTAIWSVIGNYDEDDGGKLQGLRGQIVDLLTSSPIPLTPAQVAERLKADRANIRQLVSRMLKDNQVVRGDANGSYTVGKPTRP